MVVCRIFPEEISHIITTLKGMYTNEISISSGTGTVRGYYLSRHYRDKFSDRDDNRINDHPLLALRSTAIENRVENSLVGNFCARNTPKCMFFTKKRAEKEKTNDN